MLTPLQETASLIISSPRHSSYQSLDVINPIHIIHNHIIPIIVNHSLLELFHSFIPNLQMEHSPMRILRQAQPSSKANQIHFNRRSSPTNTAHLHNNTFSSFSPHAIASQPLHKHSHP